MKRTIIFALSLGILYPEISLPQQRDREIPSWVHITAAATVAVIGGVWFYKNFVKSSEPQKEKPFKEKALDEIWYISTPAQQKALKKLKTQEEVNEFLRDFWKKSDPTPGTPENEFQDEYYRRLAYANEHFGDHREGWKTDRGRVYILYGPPAQIERLPWTQVSFPHSGTTIKTFEFWVYDRPPGENEKPNFFSNFYQGSAKFVFADQEGSGEYTQIYSSEKGEKSDPQVYDLP